jgi:hypothetical protein
MFRPSAAVVQGAPRYARREARELALKSRASCPDTTGLRTFTTERQNPTTNNLP